MSGLCSLGNDWSTVQSRLVNGESGISAAPEFAEISGLRTRLLGRVRNFETVEGASRRNLRSMGRVSMLAAEATRISLESAGLTGDPIVSSGRTGIAYGSMSGSPPAIETYARQIGIHGSLHGITASSFVQLMSHTVVANLAQLFRCSGRVIPTGADTVSGTLAIGYAAESIRWGLQDVMIAGGSEEAHPLITAILDCHGLTASTGTETNTPRPFDRKRNGLVVAEGAATLILEEREHALNRGANILGEIAGFATRTNGGSFTNPDCGSIQELLRAAILDSQLSSDEIEAVSANASGIREDTVEAQAISALFGDQVAVYALKSQLGHALGGSGAMAAWIAFETMREGWIPPILHLETPDADCGDLDLVRHDREFREGGTVIIDLGIGGANTALVLLPQAS